LRRLANVHHFPRVGHSSKPFPQIQARYRANVGRKFLAQNCVRVNLGVLSIYQPRKCQGQGVSSGFTGFYTCFLESDSAGVAG
jgi:hypothetical protein